jgi:hypothetical protein
LLPHVLFIFFMIDRVALDDDEFTIEPRPISPIPEPIPTPIVVPEPPITQPDPIMLKGSKQHDGITEADRLLGAIIVASRREPPNRAALRTLCVRFTREHALDF